MQAASNIMTAANQYAQRPLDECYRSFRDLINAAEADRDCNHEARYNLRDLHAKPGPDGGLILESPKGQARFNHYSFGQLTRSLSSAYGRGTPLLRELPPQIAADALNHGLHEVAAIGQRCNLLVRDNDPDALPIIRAATTETYGRVWDADLYANVDKWFGDGKISNGGKWQAPPVWNQDDPTTKPGGNYRGEPDSFVIRVDGGSVVTDPRGWNIAGKESGGLYRGIMIRNSEVGECSITIDCVLFDKICGNHILWGAVIDRTFRRRHVGKNVTQDVMREIITLARNFNNRSATEDSRIIEALRAHDIAHDQKAVIDELQKMGSTKEQATEAYRTAEAVETTLSPRSFWGIAAGLTRNSQESGYQDERLKLDQLAAAVLKNGARKYAMATA